MLIGVPKEIKNHEYRVGLVPSSVRELIHHGHKVLVETKAGGGIGFDDAAYKAAGATIAAERGGGLRQGRDDREGEGAAAEGVQDAAPRPAAVHLSAPGAGSRADQGACSKSGCTAIAYETVTNARGGLPLLAPMREVAGRMSVQVGAHCLEKAPGRRRHPARRRARRAAGQGRRPRRRRLRHQRRAHGDGHGGAASP